MSARWGLIVQNPISGNGAAVNLGERLSEKIQKRDARGLWPTALEVERVETVLTSADQAWIASFVARARGAERPEWIAVCGGDGTLMGVAAAIFENKISVPVVFLPGGRGNDFIRGLTDYSREVGDYMEFLADASATWEQMNCDLARGNGRLFINMASIAYGGDVVKNAHQRKAFWSKTAAVYQVEGALALIGTPERQVKVTDASGAVVFEGPLFGSFVSNGKANGSGLFWNPAADPSDGKLDAIFFKKPGVLAMNKTISIIKKKVDPSFAFVRARSSRFVFEFSEPVAAEFDGDYVGDAPRWEFESVPAALKLWVPHRPLK